MIPEKTESVAGRIAAVASALGELRRPRGVAVFALIAITVAELIWLAALLLVILHVI